MKYQVYVTHSLETIFYDSKIKRDNLSRLQAFENEAASFQIAFKPDYEPGEANGWDDTAEMRADIISPIKKSISFYTVENVPLLKGPNSISDDWVLRKGPGVYPDRFQSHPKNYFFAPVGCQKSIWININEELENISPGNYDITIRFYNLKFKKYVAETSVTFTVLKGKLPKPKIIMTNWLHYDCMAHFSNTKPFSEKFFKVCARYIKMAAQNGQNMVYLPAFTPALDTPVGKERKTTQLVRVELRDGKFTFDFSLLERFINMALDCGAEYFEHCHMYTQWGAEHAPKIVVYENGKPKKFFGWKTDAHSDEYKNFIHSYIAALKVFIKEKGLENRFFFHISDEPAKEHLESYTKASEFMQKELEGFRSGDALAEYEYYEKGLVQTPIVAEEFADDFLGRTTPLWLYYTGYQSFDYLSNRVIGMPKERNRVLGVQLYYLNIEGFLNWGFNAHHDKLSRKMVNPGISGDMDACFGGGSSYLVYPDGEKVLPSVRLMGVRDLMQDISAFEALEELVGRDEVCKVIKEHIPDISLKCRVSAEQLFDLRNHINSLIAENA